MTECSRADIRDRLPDWVHGTLGAQPTAEVAAHLGECALCRAEVALLRDARSALEAAAPRVDTARVAAALATAKRHARPRSRPASAWRSAVGVMALAASLVAVAVLSVRSPRTTAPRQRGLEERSAPEHSPTAAAERGARTPSPTTGMPAARPRAELSLAGAGELGDDDLRTLLAHLEAIDAMPETTPAPLLTTFDEDER